MTSRSGNGLVLLYEAAMLLEQQRNPGAAAKVALPSNSVASLAVRAVAQRQPIFKSPGVAKRLPTPLRLSPRPRAPVANRSSHNELEKTRRAHLRQCLDSLRDQLPLAQGEACRLTMLNVLKRSYAYMRELEALAGDQRSSLRQEERRRQELLNRRAQLLRRCRSARKARRLAAAAAAPAAATSVVATDADAGAGVLADAAAAADAWRSRNVSEISAASGSSEDTELASMESRASKAVVVGQRTGRGTACSSPDSGYASPPACSA